jgi:hypothetical protein
MKLFGKLLRLHQIGLLKGNMKQKMSAIDIGVFIKLYIENKAFIFKYI